MRSDPEIKRYQVSGSAGKVTEWPGVERVYCPVFPEESYDPVSLAVRHKEYLSGEEDGMVSDMSFICIALRRILRLGVIFQQKT